MTDYKTKATEILAKTEDLARDLESHLGLAARTREWNPTFDTASEFRAERPEGQSVERQTHTDRFVSEYHNQASQAAKAVQELQQPGQTLTTAEAAARDTILALVDEIHAVQTHDDAIALVATINE
ncbi:hypothetical protein [Agromyces humatus]|uniref:Uncharacterized protein n=1 Tax=Agromyces humatus TaxID=279573 RepID=A0ABP4X216_9MICO|nr:hypothetical protein [Agromyces humatus]